MVITYGLHDPRENEQREQNSTSQKDTYKAQWIGIEHWPFLISGSKACFSCSYFIFI